MANRDALGTGVASAKFAVVSIWFTSPAHVMSHLQRTVATKWEALIFDLLPAFLKWGLLIEIKLDLPRSVACQAVGNREQLPMMLI